MGQLAVSSAMLRVRSRSGPVRVAALADLGAERDLVVRVQAQPVVAVDAEVVAVVAVAAVADPAAQAGDRCPRRWCG